MDTRDTLTDMPVAIANLAAGRCDVSSEGLAIATADLDWLRTTLAPLSPATVAAGERTIWRSLGWATGTHKEDKNRMAQAIGYARIYGARGSMVRTA